VERKHLVALEHWGLERWPFHSAATAEQFYPTAGNSEALARIEYLVESRRRLGVLLAESGVGKSLILRVAARQLARRSRSVMLVDVLGESARELLWQIAAGFGASPHEDANPARLWRQISDSVVENRLQQVESVLLVDDVGQAGPDVITHLVRLSRLDASPAACWTILLAAEPAQAARWSDSLRELVDLRIDLDPWATEDTVGYVQTALVEAGRVEPLFEDHALVRLHELAAGVPRRVARLADYALLAGAAANIGTIDVETVEAADDEIAWPATAEVY
jgi:general secretion pathway protein A